MFMNRYTLLYIIVFCLMSLASCSDNDYSPTESSLKIVESEVEFSAQGGDGQITISDDTAISTVESSDEWCKVASTQNNIVKLTVAANQESNSRNAVITITDAKGNKAHVAVSQSGMLFSLEENKVLMFKDKASEGTVEILSNTFTVTLDSKENSDWLSASVEGNKISVRTTENNTGKERVGCVYCTCGSRKDSIYVIQMEAKDVYGDYMVIGDSLEGFDESIMSWHIKLNLAPSDKDGKIKLTFPDFGNSYDVDFDEGNIEFKYPAGLFLGTIYRSGLILTGNVDCYTGIEGYKATPDDLEVDYQDNSHTMTAYLSANNGQLAWRFKNDGSWQGYVVNGICIICYMNNDPNTFDAVAILTNPYMVRLQP